jgi:hypothetical protein
MLISVHGARLAVTSVTRKQGGKISLEAAVPTVGVPTGPTVKEEEEVDEVLCHS